jgi:hypothetical protein
VEAFQRVSSGISSSLFDSLDQPSKDKIENLPDVQAAKGHPLAMSLKLAYAYLEYEAPKELEERKKRLADNENEIARLRTLTDQQYLSEQSVASGAPADRR